MQAVFEAAKHTAKAASNATSSLCHISALIIEEEEDFDACIPTAAWLHLTLRAQGHHTVE